MTICGLLNLPRRVLEVNTLTRSEVLIFLIQTNYCHFFVWVFSWLSWSAIIFAHNIWTDSWRHLEKKRKMSAFFFVLFCSKNCTNKKTLRITAANSISTRHFLCPPTMVEGGHIVFSADPVGIGVACCPHSISLLNGHILAKLTQIYHWEGEKC